MPANLADPSALRCAACGFFGAPPPEIGGRLHAARGVLFGLDVRLRQLSAAQRRALTNAANYRLEFILISAILAVLLSCWAIPGVTSVLSPHDPTDDRGVSALLLAVLPLCSFTALALIVYRVLRRKHQALEDACAARPPREKGEPAGCHVCGAPLSAGGADFVARCAFCQADNIVDPQVLTRAGGQQVSAADAIERSVEREARATAGATGLAGALMLPAAIAMPFLAVLWIIILSLPLIFIELPANTKYRYVAVSTPAGQCIARLRKKRTGEQYLDFGSTPPEGVPEQEAPKEGAELETFDAMAMMGRVVRMESGKKGRVVKIYETPGFSEDNDIDIEPLEGGKTEWRSMCGACFAEGDGAPGQ